MPKFKESKMLEFALVIFFHVGALGSDNANATTVDHGFETLEMCQAQIKKVKSLAVGTKAAKATCIQVK
jgi:hypothetical protein